MWIDSNAFSFNKEDYDTADYNIRLPDYLEIIGTLNLKLSTFFIKNNYSFDIYISLNEILCPATLIWATQGVKSFYKCYILIKPLIDNINK